MFMSRHCLQQGDSRVDSGALDTFPTASPRVESANSGGGTAQPAQGIQREVHASRDNGIITTRGTTVRPHYITRHIS